MTIRKWGNEATLAGSQLAGQFEKSLDVAVLKDGSYVVAWAQAAAVQTIMVQRFASDGTALGEATALTGSQGGGEVALAATADGGFVLAYSSQQGATTDSFYHKFAADGSLTSTVQWDQFSSALHNEQNPAVAATASGFLIAETDYIGGGDIYVQYRDLAGNVVPLNGLNFPHVNIFPNDQGEQRFPNIAAHANGSFAVVWADVSKDSYYLRWFSPGGQGSQPILLGSGITDETNLPAIDYGPQVAALTDGKFIAVWHDSFSGSETSYSIRARLFDQEGSTFTNFTVNTTINGNQFRPDVLALPSGGFVITWTDTFLGDANITGQVFNARGEKVGSEFMVNTGDPGADQNPHIAGLSDGRLIIVWANADGTVRQQIIDPRDGIVHGSQQNDTLYGHDALGDEILGFDGDDIIFGLAGNDQVYAGGGKDDVTLGRGDDTAFGGNGDDDMRGGSGEDVIHGEDGLDSLSGGRGDDELFGGKNADKLSGGAGDDTLNGGLGADLLDGGDGLDTADYSTAAAAVNVALNAGFSNTGEAAGDTFVSVENVTGSKFNDILRGTTGANVIEGGLGNDRIEGLEGADTITGGGGNDTFFFRTPLDGADTITDFSSSAGNDDRFEVRGSNFAAGLMTGALQAAQFQSSTSDVALDASVRFFYETDTGRLFFDRDGSAGVFGPQLLATLQPGAVVTVGDFTII